MRRGMTASGLRLMVQFVPLSHSSCMKRRFLVHPPWPQTGMWLVRLVLMALCITALRVILQRLSALVALIAARQHHGHLACPLFLASHGWVTMGLKLRVLGANVAVLGRHACAPPSGPERRGLTLLCWLRVMRLAPMPWLLLLQPGCGPRMVHLQLSAWRLCACE